MCYYGVYASTSIFFSSSRCLVNVSVVSFIPLATLLYAFNLYVVMNGVKPGVLEQNPSLVVQFTSLVKRLVSMLSLPGLGLLPFFWYLVVCSANSLCVSSSSVIAWLLFVLTGCLMSLEATGILVDTPAFFQSRGVVEESGLYTISLFTSFLLLIPFSAISCVFKVTKEGLGMVDFLRLVSSMILCGSSGKRGGSGFFIDYRKGILPLFRIQPLKLVMESRVFPDVGGCESCLEFSLLMSSPILFELFLENTVLLPGCFEKLDKFYPLIFLASLTIERGVAFFLKCYSISIGCLIIKELRSFEEASS